MKEDEMEVMLEQIREIMKEELRVADSEKTYNEYRRNRFGGGTP